MEKGPEIRIIGNASDEKKEQAKQEIERAFFNHLESLSSQDREQMEKFEYPKSKIERVLIGFANKETDELMKEAGVEPYDIPEENYHICPTEIYRKAAGDRGTATTFNSEQAIIFDAQYFRDNPVNFGATALHETLHLKAHFSLEAEEKDGEIKKTPYREGIAVRALQRHGYHGNYHVHFWGLHEAIVATQEKKSSPKLLELPELAKEREWLLSAEAVGLKKKIAEKEEIPEDDIIWVGKKGEKDWKSISYRQHRQVLDYVCSEIQKQFSGQYQSAESVFKEFLKAHFTGQLLSVARLVEATFGKGGFRILGNMEKEGESARLHLETLKKERLRQREKQNKK